MVAKVATCKGFGQDRGEAGREWQMLPRASVLRRLAQLVIDIHASMRVLTARAIEKDHRASELLLRLATKTESVLI